MHLYDLAVTNYAAVHGGVIMPYIAYEERKLLLWTPRNAVKKH